MSTLFPSPITIRRYSSGYYVRGVYVNGAESILTLQGSVQPIAGYELEQLPVDRQNGGSIKIYTSAPLIVSSEGHPDITSDVVVWSGKLWEVWQSQVNGNNLIPHFKSIAQYIGEAP